MIFFYDDHHVAQRPVQAPLVIMSGIERYLKPGFGRLRCSRRKCFVCISCVLDALPEQCLRRKPGSYLLVTAVFKTKWLLCERCAATCLRRRRAGQVRRRQGRLQITIDSRQAGSGDRL
jgi:hypothetical protein